MQMLSKSRISRKIASGISDSIEFRYAVSQSVVFRIQHHCCLIGAVPLKRSALQEQLELLPLPPPDASASRLLVSSNSPFTAVPSNLIAPNGCPLSLME